MLLEMFQNDPTLVIVKHELLGIFLLWNNVWCFHCMKCHLYYINIVSC